MFLPGSLGNVLPRAALPKVEESIWYPDTGPPSPTGVIDATPIGLNLGVQIATLVPGDILSVCYWRFHAGAPSSGTVALWIARETVTPRALVATQDFTGHTGTGWKKVDFDTPARVSAGESYFATVWFPAVDGSVYAGSTVFYFAEDTTFYSENGLVWAWPNSGSPQFDHGIYKHNGWYKYGAFDCPDDQNSSANYWIDVVLRASPPVIPPDPPIVLKWPIPDGYPNLENTGIPPGTELTELFNTQITTAADGEIYEDLYLNGGHIWVRHHNVTVRRCKFYFRAGWNIVIEPGILGTIIEDCDINMGFRGNGSAQGIGGAPLAIRRCSIYRGENGIVGYGIYGDGSVQQVYEDNIVHSLRSSPGIPHYDCVQFNGGVGNILIRHNTLFNENSDTSTILIQNLFGPINGIRVEDNIMAGGGFTTYCVGRTDDPSIDPITVQYYNNKWTCGAFGYVITTAGLFPDQRGNQYMTHGEQYDAAPPDGFTAGQMVRERFVGMPLGPGTVPGALLSDAVSGITLGLAFTVSKAMSLVGVNLPKLRSDGELLNYKVGVWRFTGADRNAGHALLYQETIPMRGRDGWNYLPFTTPVSLPAGQNIVVGVWHPPNAEGRVWLTAISGVFDANFPSQFGSATAFNGAGVPLNGFTGGNGLYNYGPDLAPPLDQISTRPSYNIDPILEAPWASIDSIPISGQQVTANVGQVTVTAGNAISIIPANQRVTVGVGQPTVTAVIAGSIPLTYGDARFASNTTSSSITMSSGTLLRKSITDTGSTASIVALENIIVDTCRVNSRECVRVAGSGVDIRNTYLEATGTGDDHADIIQAYAPGERGSHIKVTNSAIVGHNTAANGGLFTADDWGGSVTLNNVMFQGSPYGLKIHSDPGCVINVSLKDVFFVGPFGYGPLLLYEVGSGIINVTLWENVRNATIVGGVLVPGSSIPVP